MTDTRDPHEAVTAPWARDILDFWFKEIGEGGWWGQSERTDAACLRYEPLWRDKRHAPAEAFLDRADEALAAIILFDQIPRNLFRGTADAFATDSLARDIARGAVAKGYDVQIGGAGRMFFYMPFQHSEAMADQDVSLVFFQAYGDDNALEFAKKHHDMIARYGRFPHRNAALGRADRPEEAEAIEAGNHW
ncbi:DUF924 domain-containing protein [Sphingobium phenoxybenzoativorans]|uniref:DUF924 domain-containing protein n=1 Tax=Sphingobium phenoxybenzoativorans TaxID=1592790 RepID=A0A975Q2H0_9SPHN|nr:DUF924 family protein [Sphingobium phenoxybenzoativorans]QUT06447.1 DUF924 domain-containing protein [Sphingobium phenoxybenzoativorans]